VVKYVDIYIVLYVKIVDSCIVVYVDRIVYVEINTVLVINWIELSIDDCIVKLLRLLTVNCWSNVEKDIDETKLVDVKNCDVLNVENVW
jgi:hypothetical protein